MPIYAYRCAECGFQKDHLQKVSDPLLTQCPECGKPSYKKMLTAAGFQLKGTGWYVTDFKGGGAKTVPAVSTESKSDDAAKPAATEAAAPKTESAATPAATPAASTTPSSSAG